MSDKDDFEDIPPELGGPLDPDRVLDSETEEAAPTAEEREELRQLRQARRERILRGLALALIVFALALLIAFAFRGCSGGSGTPERGAEMTLDQDQTPVGPDDNRFRENLDVPRPSTTPTPDTPSTPRPPPLANNEEDLEELLELTVSFVNLYFSGNQVKSSWLDAMRPMTTARLMGELETVNVVLLTPQESLPETTSAVELGDTTAVMQTSTTNATVTRIQAVKRQGKWLVNRFSIKVLAE